MQKKAAFRAFFAQKTVFLVTLSGLEAFETL